MNDEHRGRGRKAASHTRDSGLVPAELRVAVAAPSSRLRIAISVAGIVALVSGSLALALFFPKGTATGGATNSTGPTAATNSTGAAATAEADWTHLTWSEPVPFGDATAVDDVASRKGELWAVGHDATGQVGFWSSPDGGAWKRAIVDVAVFAGAKTLGLLADPSGLVAYGRYTQSPCGPTNLATTCGTDGLGVWTSPDGATWTRSATPAFDDATVVSVASGPDGLIAVGQSGWTKPEIWTSLDGRAWQSVDVAGGAFGNAHFFAVRGWSGGYLVAGSVGGTAPSPAGSLSPGAVAAAWWSTDGRSWHSATVNRIFDTGVAVLSINVGRGGFLAMGSAWGGSSPTSWWSADGKVWDSLAETSVQVSGGGVVTDPPSHPVFDGGTRMVAFAARGPDLSLEGWTSLDGKNWSELPFPAVYGNLPHDPGHPADRTFGKAFVLADGMLIVGQAANDPPTAVSWRVTTG